MPTITIATYITMLRLLLVIPINYYIISQDYLISAILFFIAAITDFLDGFIARQYNQQSKFGALLDPVADKLLLLSSFGSFTILVPQLVPFWFFVFLFIKEFCLMVGSVMLYVIYGSIDIKPHALGKFSTFIQIVFIIFFCTAQQFEISWLSKKIYSHLLFLIVGINIVVFMQYYKQGMRSLKN